MDRTPVIRAALRALGRNKLRTALSLLGDAGRQFRVVEAGGRNVNGVRTGTGATKSLTLADMKAILQNFPIIKGCSPQVDSDRDEHNVHDPDATHQQRDGGDARH